MFILSFISILCIAAVNLSDITHYEILGVAKQASTQEIRQAYKKLAIKFHPDKNPDSKEQEMFLKITEAYETLKDPDKRYRYDTYGSYSTYTRKYDYHSQSEYNNLYYNGLYHEDPFVDTLSSGSFSNYLQEGLYFINFYSPFCPPCQSLADTWKKLAEIYKGVVKVAAVNCKYYNNFCYNSMRIGSYPSLLFYPNGKEGTFVYYRGERSLEALSRFVAQHVRRAAPLRPPPPSASPASALEGPSPVAYVLGAHWLEPDALARLAYHLRGVVALSVVEDEEVRAQLGGEAVSVVLFKGGERLPLFGADEHSLLRDIANALPPGEAVDEARFKQMREELRSGQRVPWVLYFYSEELGRLPMHRLRAENPNMHFGEVDCSASFSLCMSLGASPGGWAALKPGGAFQRLGGSPPLRGLLRSSIAAVNLHSLSHTEFDRILRAEVGTWVVLVVPRGLPAEPLAEQFTRASAHFRDSEDISFGIMECSGGEAGGEGCEGGQAQVLLQERQRRHQYAGPMRESELADFVRLVLDTKDAELSEQQVLEVMAPGRQLGWLLGFFPHPCGHDCQPLLLQWRLVATKLRPLRDVRVGIVQCAEAGRGASLCANVRAASARYYAPGDGRHHHTVSLQQLSQAPYMWHWALQQALPALRVLDADSFQRDVDGDQGDPASPRLPWLVYFHSPRCYRCYELFADFAIAGVQLSGAVRLGTVDCVRELGLCQRLQVRAYPSLRLRRGGRETPLTPATHHQLLAQLAPMLRQPPRDEL